jgi:hypothetical protein
MMTDMPDHQDFFSAAFSEHLEQSPPGFLYHYTGQEGLLGIIGTSSLWATDIRYMNDATEFRLSLDLFKKRLWKEVEKEFLLTPPYPVRIERAGVLWKFANEIAGMEIYATCFCENGDLLSQWRGYAASGYGYALGLKSPILRNTVNGNPSLLLGKCIYDAKSQGKIIGEAVEYLLDEGPTDHDELIQEFLGVLTYGAFFKHPSFIEEQEWRLISIYGPSDKRHFRRGKSMIIPHTSREIGIGEKSALDHIVIGPCPHMALAKEAIKRLLSEANIRASIRASSIPFRDW